MIPRRKAAGVGGLFTEERGARMVLTVWPFCPGLALTVLLESQRV